MVPPRSMRARRHHAAGQGGCARGTSALGSEPLPVISHGSPQAGRSSWAAPGRRPRSCLPWRLSRGLAPMVTDVTHLFAGFALAGPSLDAVLARTSSWDPASLAPGSATGAPVGGARAVVVRGRLEIPLLEVYVRCRVRALRLGDLARCGDVRGRGSRRMERLAGRGVVLDAPDPLLQALADVAPPRADDRRTTW